MIKKIDNALNWILVVLVIIAAVMGMVSIPALAIAVGAGFIAAVIVRMIINKKNDSNIIKFKRKD